MFETVVHRLAPFAREFTRHGKRVYLVGGAVRNLLLGRPVQDFDFTTDALPTEVQAFFPRVLPTGLQHGTVTVLFHGESFEVTTFRIDGTYSDGRRPDGVAFTPSLTEDLARRDFTINAMALDLETGVLADPLHGQDDLRRRIIRAIGVPGQRFDEDSLRILRLFRFAAQLGFSIDPATLEAVGPRIASLSQVSSERIREELVKALKADHPERAWGPLAELSILARIFAPLSLVPLPPSALSRLKDLHPELRWSFWLTVAAGSSKEHWEKILKTLTFSNAETASILGPPRALPLVNLHRSPAFRAKAIIEAWGSRERVSLGLEYLRAIEAEGLWHDEFDLKTELSRVAASGLPVFIGELALNGKDIINEGIPAGPRVGQVLKQLQEEVWDNPGLNSGEILKSRVRSLR